MSQPCEKKCDCKQYSENDHRAALLSMELPDLEYPNNGTGYIVYRTVRFVGYIVVLSLLAYSLWRIRTIETKLSIHEKEANISRILAMSSSNLQHHQRTTRSAKDQLLMNSFGGDKELPKGTLLTSKNENVMPKMKKIRNKEDFQLMVSALFDKIHKMHDDPDRANFDNNMKEVFQAWFPVFEALLPHEYFVDEETTRSKRSVVVNHESLEEMDVNAVKKSSEESSKEKGKDRQKKSPVELVDESKSSSEKKKPKPARVARSADKSSEESKSSESMEENVNKNTNKYYKNKKNVDKKTKKQKSSEESSESSQSNEKKEDKERLNLVYQTVTEVGGAERRIIVTSD